MKCPEILNICREIAGQLIHLNETSSNASLLFPKYRSILNSKIRISEQESKILFAHHFLNNNMPFSVEAPTSSLHSFSGKTELSARFDIVIFKSKTECEFDWVIELKAHNPNIFSFQKDLEKMIAANCNCLWFHTLRNENKGTISSILNKFQKSFAVLSNNVKVNTTAKIILFFVVINKKTIYSTEFQFTKWELDLPKDRNGLNMESLP